MTQFVCAFSILLLKIDLLLLVDAVIPIYVIPLIN